MTALSVWWRRNFGHRNDRDHWTADAERVTDAGSANPLWGLVAEDDWGELLLPSWGHDPYWPGGYWSRPLNLKRPTHWLPYLRSRISHRIVMVEAP